jgi:uncharacterized repeat protein (TIGR01451 family)
MSNKRVSVIGKQLVAILLMAVALLLAVPTTAFAAGTAAGTQLNNTARLTYSLNGVAAEPLLGIAPTVIVAKLLNVLVTWQDSTPITANSPDTDRPLTFLVTNTGNGTDTYKLSRNNAVAGDQFDPVTAGAGSVWLESGAEAGFQATGPNADVLYIPGVNDPSLAADKGRVIYLLSAIPAGLSTGNFGKTSLIAASTIPGAAGGVPGSVVATANGMQTVVGAGGGQGSAPGSYLVGGVSLGLAKSITSTRDPGGGTRVMTGSVLTYRLVLSITGSGVAEAVVVTDPLPATLSYVAGSLTVNGAARTDAADADDVAVVDGAVKANFGTVTAPATRVLEFKATVN